MANTKTYLGDSVHAEFLSDGDILLTTECGGDDGMPQEIYLVPEVWKKLSAWVKSHTEEQKDG